MAFSRTASGLLLPSHVSVQRRPLAIDLFCGCGGFSLGFLQAGFEIVAAADHDPVCAQTYLMNLGAYPVDLHFVDSKDKEKLEKLLEREAKGKKDISVMSLSGQHRSPEFPGVKHFWLGDIRKVKGQDILNAAGLKVGDIDCVFGGPPCQGFSRIGKQEVLDPRNSLVFEFARLILEILPKSMVMENVPGILNMVTPEGIPVLDAFCRVLSDGGFGAYDALVKSLKAQHGSWGTVQSHSQSRKRGEKQSVENGQMSLFEVQR